MTVNEDWVREAFAHLTFTSRAVSTDEMLKVVGLEPYRTWMVGDQRTDLPKESRFRLIETNGIEFRSAGETLGGQSNIDELLAFIRDHQTSLKRLAKHSEVDGILGVWSYSSYATQSFELSTRDIGLLHELGVAFWIDACFGSPS